MQTLFTLDFLFVPAYQKSVALMVLPMHLKEGLCNIISTHNDISQVWPHIQLSGNRGWGLLNESVERDIGFCIYTIPLGTILQHYKFLYHVHGDDAQLYCSFDLDSPDEVLSTIST